MSFIYRIWKGLWLRKKRIVYDIPKKCRFKTCFDVNQSKVWIANYLSFSFPLRTVWNKEIHYRYYYLLLLWNMLLWFIGNWQHWKWTAPSGIGLYRWCKFDWQWYQKNRNKCKCLNKYFKDIGLAGKITRTEYMKVRVGRHRGMMINEHIKVAILLNIMFLHRWEDFS